MKTILFFGRWFVPGITFLLVLSALYSFAPAHATPSHVSEENTNFVQEPITGTVYDIGGPIPGVTVRVKGTALSTITNEVGEYTIKAPPGSTLVFSYPGYENIEIKVQDQFVIDVELSEIIALQEAVINAGYYTVKDKERTGSISKITSKEIENQPVNNVLEALQGRVPGLDIVPTTGLAGGGYTVRIRGQNSIAAGNDPLYIVDGVPLTVNDMSSQAVSGAVLPGGTINPLNLIDPSLIESIEVLKDADATAIYGSRGANGVILITTKRGKLGKTSLTVDISSSINNVTKFQDLLNTEQYLKMRREAFMNDGILEYPSNAYDINGTWDPNRYTDWQRVIFGNPAHSNTVRLNISGGGSQTRFYVGGSFMKENTVFPKDYNYKRTSVFSSIHHNSKNNKLQVGLSTNFGVDNNYLPATDISFRAYHLSPNAPALFMEDGALNWENSTWNNPFADLESEYRNKTKRLQMNSSLSYQLLHWLKFSTNVGYNYNTLSDNKTNPTSRFNPAWGLTSASSNLFIGDSDTESWILEPQLDGGFKWGASKFSYLLGATLQEQAFNQIVMLGLGFPTDFLLNNINAAETVMFLNITENKYRYIAGYTRLNYNLNNKYFLNLTARRDGSSRFGPGNKFANFGAIGAAWIFSNELFLKNNKILSFGKLRASYGTSGNDQIGDYQYLSTYTINNSSYEGNIGLSPTRLFNPNFAWEKNKKTAIALELSFLNNRIRLEAEYYNSISENQLSGIPLPGTTGFNIINSNLNASVENSGWELSVQSKNIDKKSFVWETSLALSIPRTKLIKYPDLEASPYSNLLEIGYPLNILKMYEFTGVNPDTGLFEFKDFNGDGVISPNDDRKFIVDLSPSFLGSLTNDLKFKQFNLAFSFYFVKKKGRNEFYGVPNAGSLSNQPVSVLNNWQQSGDHASYQLYSNSNEAVTAYSNFTSSSGAISDASFLRLRNLSIGYDLPLQTLAKCNIYLQAQNLFLITKFKGGDPEIAQGVLPPLRKILIGTKINF
jgi:TonB-linked SusC/RagA family outer membrane protein